MKRIFTIFLTLCLTFEIQAQSAAGVTLNAYMGDDLVIMDGCAIYFNESADSVDLDDAIKLANPLENIAIQRGNKVLAIEQRTTYVTTPLFLWNVRDLEYELTLTKVDVTVPMALEDLELHTLTYFQDTPVAYRFRSDSDVVYGRFRIVFPCVLAIDTTPTVRIEREKSTFGVYPNPGSYVYVKGLRAGRYDVVFTTQNGVRIKTYAIRSDGHSHVRIDHKLAPGVYYMTVEDRTVQIIVQ